MQDSKFIDYYAILNIPFNATEEQIEKSYRQSLLQNDTTAEHQSLVELSYTVLIDSIKRKVYDENYVRLQMGETLDESPKETVAEYIKEDADSLLALTQDKYQEFDQFVSEQLANKEASLAVKEQAADKAEELYKRGMWPLLGKLRELVGETSYIYHTACEFHSRAVFSLGDLCMWATHYERAVGMYNTALALSANNHDLALRCAKAIELARMAFDESRVSTQPLPAFATSPSFNQEPIYLPYINIVFFVLMGLFFTMFCIWTVLIMLDTIFLV